MVHFQNRLLPFSHLNDIDIEIKGVVVENFHYLGEPIISFVLSVNVSNKSES